MGFSDPPEGNASKAPLLRCAFWQELAIPCEARLALTLWRRCERVCIYAQGYSGGRADRSHQRLDTLDGSLKGKLFWNSKS